MKFGPTNQYGVGNTGLFAAFFIVVLVVAGVLLYKHDHNTQTSNTTQPYQNVISKFVTAMEKGNTSVVASLESPQFSSWIKSSTTAAKNTEGESGVVVTNNFYNLAKQDGELGLFKGQFLAGAEIKTGDYQGGLYVPAKGTTGMSETFDTKTNDYSAPAYSPSFTIDVVRSGDSWLVDNVGFDVAAT